jgi:HEAT repeat protein
MTRNRTPPGGDYDAWVRLLAHDPLRQRAKRHLFQSGSRAVPALRRGLAHPHPIVRRTCVNLLDHFVDDASVADLVAAVDDPDRTVAARALHALACDTCKEGACRPGEDLFVPRALSMLDPSTDPHLRAAAIDALGKVAGHRPEVADALREVARRDPDPGLRSMARRKGRVRGAPSVAAPQR